MRNIGTLNKTVRLMRTPKVVRHRLRKRALVAGKSILWRMKDGPVDKAWLKTPGTLPFRLGSWFGYYDGENKWVQL